MANKKLSNEGVFSDDTRLALLEHTIVDINKTLERFEKRFDKIDEKTDSHFKWTLILFFGLYVSIIGAVIKATHFFG